jgi:hypothetical protein
MRYELRKVGALQAGKLMAILYGIIGLLIAPFFLIGAIAVPDEFPMGLVFAVCVPFLYAAVGFVSTVIGCWLYNVLAGALGGVEVTLNERARGTAAAPTV